MKFVKFTEHNEWEGESWNFWLQLDGNEKELKELQAWLGTFDDDGEVYELDMTPVEEDKVDFVVQNVDGTDYLHENTKVTGVFTCPSFTDDSDKEGWEQLNDHFYKGEIASHFKHA